MGRDVPMIVGWTRGGMLAAMVMMAGCGWKGPQPLQAWKAVGESDNIIALDEGAHTLVAIQTKGVGRTDDGRMSIRLELANLSKKDLTVQVQTLFRDKAGVPTGDDTPFEALVLPGGGSVLYETASLAADAAKFTVQVKTP
jgi:hypothetical protein